MFKFYFAPLVLILSASLILSSCNSVMKSMVGQYNVESVQLARYCQVDSALAVVKKSRDHQSVVNQSQGLILEVIYLKDLGRPEEAKELYPRLIKRSPWLKSDKEIERAAKKGMRDLGKMRKRSGYEKDCSSD